MDGIHVNVSLLIKDIAYSLLSTYHDNSVAYSQAWNIIEHITGKRRIQFITNPFIALSGEQKRQLDLIVDKVKRVGMPLLYALGTAPFLGLDLTIKPPVLIPRTETEGWCAKVLELIEPLLEQTMPEKPFTVLDLCTGSGCIALALAAKFKDKNISIIAIDNSVNALDCAQFNAEKYKLTDKCLFIRSDLYAELPPDFSCDLIVANPPYIQHQEFLKLDPTVRYWEDYHALVSGSEGVELIKDIVGEAGRFLRNTYGCAQLWCEIGHQQGEKVTSLFKASDFHALTVLQDLRGQDRLVRGTASCVTK